MLLIYLDESGDTGLPIRNGSPTSAFAVAAVAVREKDWAARLDDLIRWRRWVRDHFGIRMRDELKAGYLIHGTGPCVGIGEKARMRIFRQAMRMQPKTGRIRTFASVVNKHTFETSSLNGRYDPRELAWENMIERIERMTNADNELGLLFPDEGHEDFLRKKLRGMRRFHPVPSRYTHGTSLARPAVTVIEDPVTRRSHESYFTQLADLNAYAAHRRCFPAPWFDGSYWDALGTAIHTPANSGRTPLGIVFRP